MESLYLDHNEQTLIAEHNCISIRETRTARLIVHVPMKQVSEIIMFGDITFTSSALRRLGKAHINLVCLNRTDSQANMLCHNMQSGNIGRKLKQFKLCEDTLGADALAKYVVVRKLERQQAMLKKSSEVFGLKGQFDDAIAQIETYKQSSDTESLSVKTLLGLEGSAARIYFECIAKLIHPKWAFEGRKRRPSPDPLNALLSLTYTLLHYEIVKQLLGKGLDPYLGFFHKPDYGRASLACDALELLRPEIDFWVIHLMHIDTFSARHFKRENGAVTLAKQGRCIYFQAVGLQMKKWRKRVRAYVELFCQHIDGYTDNRNQNR